MPQEELNIVMKASDILKKQDFKDNFKRVLDVIIAMQKKQAEAIRDLQQTYAEMMNKMQETHGMNYSDLKKQVNTLFVEGKLSEMDAGQKAQFSTLKEEVLKAVSSKLKEADLKVSSLKPIKGDPGDKGDSGPMPTEHLELMKEVKEELRKTKDVLSNRSQGMRKVPIIKRFNLTSLTDGSARAFVLPRDTVDVVGVWGSDFPQNYNPLTDWTFAGNTLTLSSDFEAPRTGTTLFCIIETLFYG